MCNFCDKWSGLNPANTPHLVHRLSKDQLVSYAKSFKRLIRTLEDSANALDVNVCPDAISKSINNIKEYQYAISRMI